MKKEKINCLINNIIIIVIIMIIAISSIFTNPVSNLDEIWNFNCARNISDGLIPYKDFNMVATPLMPIICGIGLLIFGKELIVMRVFAVILMCLIFFITYKILEKLVPKHINMLLLTILLVLFKDVMCIDYNYATLLIALILVYIELKNKKGEFFRYSFKYNFIIGIIAGIAILFKQSTGTAIACACIGYKIFEIRKKEDIKEFLKIAFTRLLGVIIPVAILLTYIAINGAMKDFISYTILGVRTFSNKKPYSQLFEEKSLTILPYIIPISILVMFIMLFSKKVKEEVCILFAYSISTFIVCYPISDKIHFSIGALISFIGLGYIIYEYAIKINLNIIKKPIKIIAFFTITLITYWSLLINLYNSGLKINHEYLKVSKENELAHFKGIPENVGLKKRINEVDEFIIANKENGKNVYVLDAEAAIYYIPLNMYNKDYDMFLKGNLGADGEERIIKRIQSEENAVYLIKQRGLNWQNPGNVREYIIGNLNHTGNISAFMIYESK